MFVDYEILETINMETVWKFNTHCIWKYLICLNMKAYKAMENHKS